MAEKPTSTETLGLEIDSNSIKGAELILSKGKPALLNIFEVFVDKNNSSSSNVKLLYTSEGKSNLDQLLERNLVISTLSTPNVLARQVELTLTKEKDIDSVLEFQAEPLLPFPIEEAFVDKIIQSKHTDSTKLSVIAARKASISKHIDHCHHLGIEPEVISCVPAALASFSKLFSPVNTPHLILHLGFDSITCSLIEDGKLIAAQSTENGTGELDKIDSLLFDIQRISSALTKQLNGQNTAGLILTGEGIENKNLIDSIKKTLDFKILSLKNVESFSLSDSKIQKYAAPIGAALSGLSKEFNQINFRQGDLSYPFPWKRVQKPLITYLTLSLALAIALYICGMAYLTQKEDQIREAYITLLARMKKPYSEFEAKFTGKDSADPLSIFNLTKENIASRMNPLEKEIRTNPDLFPLLPNTPNVSDVLAWLSTHPIIIGNIEDKEPRIQLTSFNYKMVKRPEESKKRVKYQAKVEIEFTASTPTYAREFHDMLLSPNKFIDPKSDVKWGTERGKYRASFFLKDQTLYPQ